MDIVRMSSSDIPFMQSVKTVQPDSFEALLRGDEQAFRAHGPRESCSPPCPPRRPGIMRQLTVFDGQPLICPVPFGTGSAPAIC
jgi:hypothetical protein